MDYLTNWSLSAGNEHEVRDGRNVKIVNVDCGGMTGRKYDEATKIAALVRAAPALLEALEEQVGECFDPLCDMCARHAEIIASARGAA